MQERHILTCTSSPCMLTETVANLPPPVVPQRKQVQGWTCAFKRLTLEVPVVRRGSTPASSVWPRFIWLGGRSRFIRRPPDPDYIKKL